jgi:hypothetical protein
MKNDCQDSCCSHGCALDISEVERILLYKDALGQYLEKDAAQWFEQGVNIGEDFPSGYFRRTMVYDEQCVFHDWSSRGCLLHRLALEKGFDPRQIKPMVCFLFPISWDEDYLYVPKYLEELPCHNSGGLILDAVMHEIKYYLGEEAATEIRQIKQTMDDGGVISS